MKWKLKLSKAAAVLLAAGVLPAGHGQVVLNEIMAENAGAVENGPDSPDYIELFNGSGQNVSLSGWSLTDDPAVPRRYNFPSGAMIPAGGRLVVWCDSNASSPGLHSGFGLSAAGESVRLVNPGGSVVDEVAFGLQAEDLSIGRVPDGTGTWQLNRPTPLQLNQTQELLSGTPALRINEWMARPAEGDDWIELFNPETLPVDISGYVFTDGSARPPDNRPIPALSFIGSREFIQFFASDLEDEDADQLDFRLSGDGETLRLYGRDKATLIDEVTFGAQSEDVSQGRVPDGGDAIESFSGLNATPGESNRAEAVGVVINEVLTHTDPPLEDAIELYNPSGEAVDISHWWLSDSLGNPKKYRIPPGTVLAPGGYAVFYAYQFSEGEDGFALNSFEGDSVVLSAGNATGALTGRQVAVTFGALRNGLSIGRVATSVGVDFVPLSARTFGQDRPSSLAQFRQGTGAPNAAPRLSPVVINEIHFQPADPTALDEFIELHNPTAQDVVLFDVNAPTNTWRLRDGVEFEFPINLTMPAGSYALLVSFDPAQDPATLAAFKAKFSVPESARIFGPFQGRLNNAGEAIELQVPDEPEGPDSPDAGFVPFELMERIAYMPGAPWPAGAAGTGRSLQRSDALAYGNEPSNWFTGNPTAGRSNVANSDSDGDGMPDDWESANGLDPQNSRDAGGDPDGDGLSNLDEFRAGTDPRNQESALRILGIAPSAEGWTVTFLAAAGRSYAVEFRPALGSGAWQRVATSGDTGSGGAREVAVPRSGDSSGFLRIVLEPAP